MTLGCSWDCANDAVLAKGLERLVDDEHRLDGVSVIGVDEHVWRHTPRGSRYVTVVVDLTPRSDGRPARLLDVVEGRSGAVFAGWLASRSEGFRRNVRVVAMDAFAGYKEAVRRVVPHAREVLDPFHVVRLAGDRLTRCRQRLQQEATGRRGTKHDPLYKARRILLKTRATLTDRQRSTLGRLFGDERNKPLEVMWGAYQKIIACYAEPDRRKARGMTQRARRQHQRQTRQRARRAGDTSAYPQTPPAGCPGLLRPRVLQQRAHRGRQRQARTPARHRPRLHQPQQLHHPKPPARRRIQTNHTGTNLTTMNPTHTKTGRAGKPQVTIVKTKNPRCCEGPWLGCLDSNQEWLNQNQLCCQLHHTPMGGDTATSCVVFVPPTGFEPVLAP